METRIATADDAEPIARLHAESWRRTYRGMMRDEFLDGDVVQDRLDVWNERMRKPAANQYVAVAEDGAEIVGFVCVYGDDDPRWGSLIDNLHARHDAHKRGIGAALMRDAAKWCAATHPGRGLYLWVMQANENAQRFYERLGGANAGAEEHENTAGGGIAYVFRYVWPDAEALLNV